MLEYTLYAVRVFVSDWEKAVEFYQTTLGMKVVFKSPEMGWAQLDTGACNLAIERADAESEELVGRFAGVSLHVPDIQATYEVLSDRGVAFNSPPEKQSWGGTLAHFKDPDGNVLTLLGM